MENFKIEIFGNENAGEKFLFDRIQGVELLAIVQKLESLLGCKNFKDSISFFKWVDHKLHEVVRVGETDNLLRILNGIKLNVSSDTKCYLVWNFPNDIDRFDLKYLVRNWNYVWYSDSDDVVVLLIEDKVLVLVTHYGVVKWYKI